MTKWGGDVIEFDHVTIPGGDGPLVADFSGSCGCGSVSVLSGSTVLARASTVGAIAGSVAHTGRIRVTGDLFVGFADATLVGHLTGYDNIRMLANRSARRSTIDEIAGPLLTLGPLDRRGREFDLAARKHIQLVAALLSGAANLVFDRLLDGDGAPSLEQLKTLVCATPAAPAVLVTAPGAASNREVLTLQSTPLG